ncbi:unnamed protein product, partial [marine sediment metagenome]
MTLQQVLEKTANESLHQYMSELLVELCRIDTTPKGD